MASYRDPNLTKTLEIYDTTVEALIPEEVPQESLTETIIGTIGDIDSPLSPDQKGKNICYFFVVTGYSIIFQAYLLIQYVILRIFIFR